MAFSNEQKATPVGDRTEEVDGYKRTLDNGTVVTVQDHTRTNDAATAAVVSMPGRPPMAAKQGTFPNGRFLPYLWLKPTEMAAPPEPQPEVTPKAVVNPKDNKKSDDKAKKVVNALADLVNQKAQETSGGPK